MDESVGIVEIVALSAARRHASTSEGPHHNIGRNSSRTYTTRNICTLPAYILGMATAPLRLRFVELSLPLPPLLAFNVHCPVSVKMSCRLRLDNTRAQRSTPTLLPQTHSIPSAK